MTGRTTHQYFKWKGKRVKSHGIRFSVLPSFLTIFVPMYKKFVQILFTVTQCLNFQPQLTLTVLVLQLPAASRKFRFKMENTRDRSSLCFILRNFIHSISKRSWNFRTKHVMATCPSTRSLFQPAMFTVEIQLLRSVVGYTIYDHITNIRNKRIKCIHIHGTSAPKFKSMNKFQPAEKNVGRRKKR